MLKTKQILKVWFIPHLIFKWSYSKCSTLKQSHSIELKLVSHKTHKTSLMLHWTSPGCLSWFLKEQTWCCFSHLKWKYENKGKKAVWSLFYCCILVMWKNWYFCLFILTLMTKLLDCKKVDSEKGGGLSWKTGQGQVMISRICLCCWLWSPLLLYLDCMGSLYMCILAICVNIYNTWM